MFEFRIRIPSPLNVPDPARPLQQVPATPQPMHRDDFHRVREDINARAFSSERMSALHAFLDARPHISCEQARQLLEIVPFSRDQVAMANAMYPHLTDPVHLEVMLDAIAFEAARERVRRAVRAVGGGW